MDTLDLEYQFRAEGVVELEVWSRQDGYDGWMIRVGHRLYHATEVARYRDGGTTTVRCAAGVLLVPAPSRYRAGERATWTASSAEAPAPVRASRAVDFPHDGRGHRDRRCP